MLKTRANSTNALPMNIKQERGCHCIYFGVDEYEGVGEDLSRDTYSFRDGVLCDSDGDIIEVRNVVMHGCGIRLLVWRKQ